MTETEKLNIVSNGKFWTAKKIWFNNRTRIDGYVDKIERSSIRELLFDMKNRDTLDKIFFIYANVFLSQKSIYPEFDNFFFVTDGLVSKTDEELREEIFKNPRRESFVADLANIYDRTGKEIIDYRDYNFLRENFFKSQPKIKPRDIYRVNGFFDFYQKLYLYVYRCKDESVGGFLENAHFNELWFLEFIKAVRGSFG